MSKQESNSRTGADKRDGTDCSTDESSLSARARSKVTRLRFLFSLVSAIALPICGNWIAGITQTQAAGHAAAIVLSFCVLSFLQVLSASLPDGGRGDETDRTRPRLVQRVGSGVLAYFKEAWHVTRFPESAISRGRAVNLWTAGRFWVASISLSVSLGVLMGERLATDIEYYILVLAFLVAIIFTAWHLVRVALPARSAVIAGLYISGAWSLLVSIIFTTSSLIAFSFVPWLSFAGGHSFTNVLQDLFRCITHEEEHCAVFVNGITLDAEEFAGHPAFFAASSVLLLAVFVQYWLHVRLWIGLKSELGTSKRQAILSFVVSWAMIAGTGGALIYAQFVQSAGECPFLRASKTPEFNVAPVAFRAAVNRDPCSDEPLIDAEAISPGGAVRPSSSQADHNAPIHVELGSIIRIRAYLRNGASDTRWNNEGSTMAQNVRLHLAISPPGIQQKVSITVTAENAPAVTTENGEHGGDLSIVSNRVVSLRYIPQSTRVAVRRLQGQERYGSPDQSAEEEAIIHEMKGYPHYLFPDTLSHGSLALGNLKGGYMHATWVFFSLLATDPNNDRSVASNQIGMRSRSAWRLRDDGATADPTIVEGSTEASQKLLREAVQQQGEGEALKAIASYESALRSETTDSHRLPILESLCWIYPAASFRNGGDRTQDGIRVCESALTIIRSRRGNAAAETSRRRVEEDASDILMHLAQLYEQRKQFDEVLKAYNEIITIHSSPDMDHPYCRALAFHSAGLALYNRQRWHEAIVAFSQARYEYERLGKTKEAGDAISDSAKVYVRLGQSAQASRVWEEAQKLYKKAGY